MNRYGWFFAVATLLAPTSASAAGFAIGEQGAASLGVMGAATARDDLPETGYYNPAATRPGVIATVGAAVILPGLTHTDPESGVVTNSEPHAATPPYVHAGWIGEAGDHRFGALLSGFVPFGAALAWPEDWAGRFEVRSIELQVFEAAFTGIYGLKLSDDIELGASGSLRALRSTVQLERNIDAIDVEPQVKLGGAAQRPAGAAALWTRIGQVKGGINFRSAARMDFVGDAHFEDVPPELSGAAHDQGVTTSVSLPERVALGIAWDPGFGVASVDAEYHRWSRFETFGINFEDEGTPDVDEPRNWHDTVALRVGYEHRFLDKALSARAGFAYDPTPSPSDTLSPTLPDATRINASLGVGYQFKFGLRADLAFANVALLGAKSEGEEVFPGEYGGGARIVSFGLGFQR